LYQRQKQVLYSEMLSYHKNMKVCYFLIVAVLFHSHRVSTHLRRLLLRTWHIFVLWSSSSGPCRRILDMCHMLCGFSYLVCVDRQCNVPGSCEAPQQQASDVEQDSSYLESPSSVCHVVSEVVSVHWE